MPDITTTLGVDASETKTGLRQAVREYETYQNELKRIDRKFGADAAREFRKTLDRTRAMRNEQDRFVRAAGKGIATVRKNWQSIATGFAASSAGIAAGGLVVERSISRYAERFDFAASRVERFSKAHSRARKEFDRNMFLAFDSSNPESISNAFFGTAARSQDLAAAVMNSIGRDGRIDIGAGLRSVRESNAQLDRKEAIDTNIRRFKNNRMISSGAEAMDESARGRTGAAAIAAASADRMRRLRGLSEIDLTPDQRRTLIASIERSYDDTESRYRRFDDSVAAERDRRSRAIRRDDGTVAGGFASRRLNILAEGEARARDIMVGDGTDATRAAAREDLRVEITRRLESLEREKEVQLEIGRIERQRAELVGQTGFDARRKIAALEAEEARARARGELTDPEALRTRMIGIDAGERAALSGIDRDAASARARGRDTLRSLRIERLRRRGNDAEAERESIRMRYAQIERDLTESLGPDGGGMLAGLREELAAALADVGKNGEHTRMLGTAPELLGGFGEVRGRVAVDRQTRILEEIRDQGRETVSFRNN